jgi:glycosyltransferase 2 family protein
VSYESKQRGIMRSSLGRQIISIGGRVLIACALLAFILLRVDLATVGQTLQHIHPILAVSAIIVMLLVGLFTAAKWLVLLRALQIDASARTVIRLTYIAVTWNLALPGGESGNLVKAALLARQKPGAAGRVWASMLIDQAALVAAELLVGMVTLTLAQTAPSNLSTWRTVIMIGLLLVICLYAAFLLPIAPSRIDGLVRRISRALAVPSWLRRLIIRAEAANPEQVAELTNAESPGHLPGEWIDPLWQGLIRYRGHISSIIAAIGLAVLYYGTIFTAYWLAALGLDLPFGYADIAWVTALAGIIALLPITIAGAGVREGIITYFLGGHGVDTARIVAFSLTVLMLNILLGMPGVVMQMIGTREKTSSMAIVPDAEE